MLTNFRNIFGTYVPVVDANGNITPDYEMIALYCMFAITLYWTFKFIYDLFK